MRRKAIPGPPRLSHAATAARSLQPAPEEAPAHTGSPLASPLPSAKLQSTLALGPSRTPLALKPRQPAAPVPRAPSRPVRQVRRTIEFFFSNVLLLFSKPPPTFLQIPCKLSLNPKP